LNNARNASGLNKIKKGSNPDTGIPPYLMGKYYIKLTRQFIVLEHK